MGSRSSETDINLIFYKLIDLSAGFFLLLANFLVISLKLNVIVSFSNFGEDMIASLIH